MELFKALSPVIQVFMLILCGFVFAQWKRINLTSLTEIIVYLGTPSLVFSSLAGKPLFVGDIAVLFGGILINSRAFVATHRDARTGDDSDYADSLGYRLHDVASLQSGHALGGALLRIFGGFALLYGRRPSSRSRQTSFSPKNIAKTQDWRHPSS